MMNLYFTKKDTFGIPAGAVERFHVGKAAALLADGTLEAYDDKNGTHRAAAEKAGYIAKPKTSSATTTPTAGQTVRK